MNIVRFLVYDLADGLIKRRGTAPDTLVHLYVQPGEGFLLEECDQRMHYVVDGEVRNFFAEWAFADSRNNE